MAVGAVLITFVADKSNSALSAGYFVLLLGSPVALVAAGVGHLCGLTLHRFGKLSQRTAIVLGLACGAVAASLIRAPTFPETLIRLWAIPVGGAAGWAWWRVLARHNDLDTRSPATGRSGTAPYGR